MKQRISLRLALVCAGLGIFLALGGWFLPAHLHAVDERVLRAAGATGSTVHKTILTLAEENHVGAAELLRQAARRQNLPDSGNLYGASMSVSIEPSMTDLFIHTRQREAELELLQKSSIPAVHTLLQTRALNNTRLFAPSSSAAGQAFDTAVVVAGLLVDQGNVTGPFRDAIEASAASANKGGDTEPIEKILLDFLSLGQRLNLDQAGIFVNNIQDPETFRLLTGELRDLGSSVPTLFAAVVMSGRPQDVAAYVRDFNDPGLGHIGQSLRYGSGALVELLHRHELAYGDVTSTEGEAALRVDNFCLTYPAFAVILKCLLYLLGGFFLSEAAHYARPMPSELERPLEVRGAHLARGSLFALGFLLVAVLLSEPFLAQQSQKMEIRLRLPTVGSAISAGSTPAKPLSSMNSSNTTLLTLLLFFVLQALIYVACLVKLAEVKRQNVPPRVKLKLLENEEHLFDAGLYLGFCGTIVSLILASLGVTGWSLMAAYSSTSFGIIFVSIFKIFQLRPARRNFLLQSEEDRANLEADALRPSLASMP